MLPEKLWISTTPAVKISVTLAMSTNLQKKSITLEKKTKKIIPGQMLGQDRPEKNSIKCFNSKRRDSESSTDIDRQNLRLRHELGALGRAPTHPLVTVFKRPVICGGRRSGVLYNTFGRCCVQNRRRKMSIPLRWQKIGLFQVGRRV